MKKPILILTILFITSMIISCSIEEPSCVGGNDWPQHKTKINSMELKLGVFQETSFSTDVTVNSYKRVALQFAVTKIDTVETIPAASALLNFSIFSSAFANPGPPEPIPLQKIKSIKIVSDKEISSGDKTFVAKSDITELFNTSLNLSFYPSVDEFLSNHVKPFGFEYDKLIFRLKVAPAKNIESHKITVALTLDDGKVFEQSIEKFTVEV